MKTIVTAPLRITVESYRAIKKEAKEEMVRPGVIIRKILHKWALRQKNHG